MLRRIAVVSLLLGWAGLFSAGMVHLIEKAQAEKTPAKAAAKPAKEAEKDEQKYLRVVRDAKGVPSSLDTAIVRYVGEKGKYAGVTVDLIGAVHIGDKAYYEALNKRFTQYEALLYELMAPKGTRIPKGGGGRSGHPIGMMQEGMTGVLDLAYQLQEVDYTKDNFVHADMTPDQFSAKMKERGESWLGMMFNAMGHGIALQAQKGGPTTEFELLFALFDENRELKMKRALAKQFEDMEGMMGAFEGEDGSTIIAERNKAALKVLARQLKKGKKQVGIFYGAAHLPDMDKRLREEFGLKRQETEWVQAWDLTEKPKAAAAPAKKKAKPAAAK